MQIAYFLCLLFLPLSFNSDSKVIWESPMEYDFGDINYKKPVQYDFVFKNISGEDLIIDNVRTTCGCTVPDWKETPIAPDSIGHIKVRFDARNLGYFRKKIKVYFDGQRKAEKLYIEGYVEN